MKEAEMLQQGKIGVIPTDTLYGVVASAFNEEAVRRVYALKGRTMTKPCIILISSLEELTEFGITPVPKRQEILTRYWPGPVSIILACGASVPEYLHRGTYTLAFRFPSDAHLNALVRASGPLIAPSANPEGLQPATTIQEAQNYFGERVDFYSDGGRCLDIPSTLIAFAGDDSIVIMRKGKQIL